MNEEWFAVIADKDIFYPDNHPTMGGRLEYAKGSVVSWGSVVTDKETLAKKGLRTVSVGFKQPDFATHQWNSETEKLDAK